ncbi:unnamed protein product [Protopolystoma xenopodis]|uniref:Uncharacterized protein n=1 Tax=Protopolystoma xenopodis TaxID=117903 RepID=A0A448WMF2_9PLAT|nr:unnamed protein product [Protopolystoma xenopodis]
MLNIQDQHVLDLSGDTLPFEDVTLSDRMAKETLKALETGQTAAKSASNKKRRKKNKKKRKLQKAAKRRRQRQDESSALGFGCNSWTGTGCRGEEACLRAQIMHKTLTLLRNLFPPSPVYNRFY